MSRKLYFEAIRALPEKWIDDKTVITTWQKNVVVAANPEYAPMKYADGKWEALEVAAPQAEVEAEKTLRFLKTGRQHD